VFSFSIDDDDDDGDGDGDGDGEVGISSHCVSDFCSFVLMRF